ncbi:MAG: hypothetical protein WB523_12075 [Candidatus Sulfotelmatobacter sp.]
MLLGSTAQQQDHPVAVPGKVNPVARTEVDPVLVYSAASALYIRQVALRHPRQRDGYLRCGWRVEAVEPLA